jgi:hypothetical protein
MICQQCRNEIAENAVICPVCGTLRAPIPPQPGRDQAQGDFKPPFENYGYYQPNNRGGYQGGYAPPPPRSPNQQGYQGYVPPQQNYGYTPPYSAPGGYAPNINVTVINNPPGKANEGGALAVEIILSLLGIFGVGWLLAGETTVGIVLLLGSIFLYWPIMFFGTLFTLGFGLIFLGPLMIASIIINAVLLNNAIKRKAAPYVIVQQPPPMQMPPQR